jgi:hypothetical protein
VNNIRIVIIKAANQDMYDKYQEYRKSQSKAIQLNANKNKNKNKNESWNFINPSFIQHIAET